MAYREFVEPTLTTDEQYIGLFRVGSTETAENYFVFGRINDDAQHWRIVNGGWEWLAWPQVIRRLRLTTDVSVTMWKVSR